MPNHGYYGPALEGNEGGDYVNIPDGVYEYFVVDLEEVPNTFWKEGDSENSKWRLKWTFQLRPSEIDDLPPVEEGKQYGKKAWYKTGNRISKHKLAKLNPTLLGYLDPDYKEENGYISFDHMKQSVMYAPIRLLVKTPPDSTWLNVEGVLKSKAGKMTDAEFVYAGLADAIAKP